MKYCMDDTVQQTILQNKTSLKIGSCAVCCLGALNLSLAGGRMGQGDIRREGVIGCTYTTPR